MGVPEIEAFLTHLAVTENVAASTQHQAFSSLLFLYHHLLEIANDREGRVTVLPESAISLLQQHLKQVITGRKTALLIGTETTIDNFPPYRAKGFGDAKFGKLVRPPARFHQHKTTSNSLGLLDSC
jgi:hypothetical protein